MTAHDSCTRPNRPALPARAARALDLAPRRPWPVAIALGVAALLTPIFVTPFSVLLGRTLFIAMALLLAFTAAGQWRQRRLPRWLAQVLAWRWRRRWRRSSSTCVSVGGDIGAMFGHERVSRLRLITGSGLVVGLVLALGALYRERDAQARRAGAAVRARARDAGAPGARTRS